MGRFANQAFQIASIIGIAVRSRQNYAFPRWINYDAAERFGSKEDINVWQHLANPLPELARPLPWQTYPYFWGYRDLILTGDWTIEAHLQSEKYFKHAIDLVRWHLTFKDEPDDMDACAIHWRAGDYTEGVETYHPRQPKSYYDEAMKHIPLGTKFKVFSDDIEGAIRMFGMGQNFEYSDKDYLTDFKMMKRCKHHIVANSSFSLIAAILASQPEKIVVAPKLWFGAAAGGLDATDLYPQNAIVI